MNRAQEIAWAAGLFEGEGCAIAASAPRSAHGTKPQVSLAMTDEWPVREFHRIIGFGNITLERRAPHKDCWWWQSGSKRDVPKLAVLLPYLSKRRQIQVRTAIAACMLANRIDVNKKMWKTRREKYGPSGRG